MPQTASRLGQLDPGVRVERVHKSDHITSLYVKTYIIVT